MSGINMEKTVAIAIVKSLEAVGRHLNSLRSLLDRLPTESDRKEFRQHLGAVMAILNADIMLPVIRDHPDLDPDK
jgi:hypothetical protein